jgi:5-hydroxyisourate hydrolase-like protein (transthyretin family)
MSPNNVDVQTKHDDEPLVVGRMSPDKMRFPLHPNIIRPIARRVPLPSNNEIQSRRVATAESHDKPKSTTIHPRLVQDFHHECQQAGLAKDAIEAAVEESNEWHRKWTLQEEEGHTGPYQLSFGRQDGTRNPPPLSFSSGMNSLDEEWKEDEGHYGPMMPHYVAFRQEESVNPPLSISSSLDDWDRLYSSPLLRPLEPPLLQVLSPLQLPARVPSSLEDEETGATATVVVPSSPISLPEQLHSVYSELSLSHNNTTTHHAVVDMESYKEALFHALAISRGDPSTREFEGALLPLCNYYHQLGWDARGSRHEEDGRCAAAAAAGERKLEGMWLTLTKASYFGSLGENNSGDPMYTLGRMAFDMFLPTQLICSLQGNFNPVHIVPDHSVPDEKIPKSLLEECKMGNHILRTYK